MEFYHEKENDIVPLKLTTPKTTRRRFGTNLSNSKIARSPESQRSSIKKVVRVRRTTPKLTPGAPPPRSRTSPNQSPAQSLWLSPGPIGLQLEPVKEHPEHGARVVRFVDGGSDNPGQCRLSGLIKPGDLVLQAEVEQTVGSTYEDIVRLLKQGGISRRLKFQSTREENPPASSVKQEEEPSRQTPTESPSDSNQQLIRKSTGDEPPVAQPENVEAIISKQILVSPLPQLKESSTSKQPTTPAPSTPTHAGGATCTSQHSESGRTYDLSLIHSPSELVLLSFSHSESAENQSKTTTETTQSVPMSDKAPTSKQHSADTSVKPSKIHSESERDSFLPDDNSCASDDQSLEEIPLAATNNYPTSPHVVVMPRSPGSDVLSTIDINHNIPSPILPEQSSLHSEHQLALANEDSTSSFSPSKVKELSEKKQATKTKPRILTKVWGAVFNNVAPAVTTTSSAIGNAVATKIAPAVASSSVAANKLGKTIFGRPSIEFQRNSDFKMNVVQELNEAKTILDSQRNAMQPLIEHEELLLEGNIPIRLEFEESIRRARAESAKTETELKELYSATVQKQESRIRQLERENVELKQEVVKADNRIVDNMENELMALPVQRTTVGTWAAPDDAESVSDSTLQNRLVELEATLTGKQKEIEDLARITAKKEDEMTLEIAELQAENLKYQEESMALRMEVELSRTLVEEKASRIVELEAFRALHQEVNPQENVQNSSTDSIQVQESESSSPPPEAFQEGDGKPSTPGNLEEKSTLALETANAELQEKLQEGQNVIEEQRERIVECESELHVSQENMASLEVTLSSTEAKLRASEDQLSDTTQEMELQANRSQNVIEEQQERIAECEDEIRQVNENIKSLEKTLSNTQAEVLDREERLARAAREMEDMKAETDKSTEELKEEILSRDEELRALETEKTDLKKANGDLVADHQHALSELAQVRDERTTTEEELRRAKVELSNSRRDTDETHDSLMQQLEAGEAHKFVVLEKQSYIQKITGQLQQERQRTGVVELKLKGCASNLFAAVKQIGELKIAKEASDEIKNESLKAAAQALHALEALGGQIACLSRDVAELNQANAVISANRSGTGKGTITEQQMPSLPGPVQLALQKMLKQTVCMQLHLKGVSSDLGKATKTASSLLDEVNSLKSTQDEQEQLNSELVEGRRVLQDKVHSLTNEIEEKNNALEELGSRIASLECESTKPSEPVVSRSLFDRELLRAQSRVHMLDGLVSSLQECQAQLEVELNTKTEECSKQEESLASLASQLQEQTRELDVAHSRLSDLEKEKESNDSTIVDLKLELRRASIHLSSQSHKAQPGTPEVQSAPGCAPDIKVLSREHTSISRALTKTSKKLETGFLVAKGINSEVTGQLELISKVHSRLHAETASLEELQNATQREPSARIESLQCTLREAASDLEAARSRIESLSSDEGLLLKELASVSSKLRGFGPTLKKLSSRFQQVITTGSRTRSSGHGNVELLRKICILEIQLRGYSQNEGRWEEELSATKSTLELERLHLRNVEAEWSKSSEKIEILEMMNGTLMQENANLEAPKGEPETNVKVEMLEMMNESLVQENAALNETITSMKQSNEETGARVATFKSNISDLENALSSEQRKTAMAQENLANLEESAGAERQKLMKAIKVLATNMKKRSSQAKMELECLQTRGQSLTRSLFKTNAKVASLLAQSKAQKMSQESKHSVEEHQKLVMRTAELQLSLSDYRGEKAALQEQVSQLEAAIIAGDANVLALQEQVTELKEELADASEKETRVLAKSESLRAELATEKLSLEDEVAELNEELTYVLEQETRVLQTSDSLRSEFVAKKVDLEIEVEELKEELTFALDQETRMLETSETLRSDLDAKKQSLEGEVAELREELTHTRDQETRILETSESLRTSLEGEVAQLTELVEASEEYAGTSKENSERTAPLEDNGVPMESATLSTDMTVHGRHALLLDDLRRNTFTSHHRLKDENILLREKLMASEESIQDMADDLQIHKTANADLLKERDSLAAVKASLEADLVSVCEQGEQVFSAKTELAKQKTNLEADLVSMLEQGAEMESAKTELAKQLEELLINHKSVSGERDDLLVLLAKSDEEAASLRSEVASTEQDRARIESDLLSVQEELQKVEERLTRSCEQVTELLEVHRSSLLEKESHQSEIRSLIERVQVGDQDIEALKLSNESERQHAISLAERVQNLEARVESNLKRAKDESEIHLKEIREIRSENASISEERDQARSEKMALEEVAGSIEKSMKKVLLDLGTPQEETRLALNERNPLPAFMVCVEGAALLARDKITQYEENCNDLEKQLETAQVDLTNASNERKNLQDHLESSRRDGEGTKAKLAHTEKKNEALEVELSSLQELMKEAEEDLTGALDRELRLLESCDVVRNEALEEKARLQTEAKLLKQSLEEKTAHIGTIQCELNRTAKENAALAERVRMLESDVQSTRKELQTQHEKSCAELEQHRSENQCLHAERESLLKTQRVLEADVVTIRLHLDESKQNYQDALQDLRVTETQIDKLSTERSTLAESKANLENAIQAVQAQASISEERVKELHVQLEKQRSDLVQIQKERDETLLLLVESREAVKGHQGDFENLKRIKDDLDVDCECLRDQLKEAKEELQHAHTRETKASKSCEEVRSEALTERQHLEGELQLLRRLVEVEERANSARKKQNAISKRDAISLKETMRKLEFESEAKEVAFEEQCRELCDNIKKIESENATLTTERDELVEAKTILEVQISHMQGQTSALEEQVEVSTKEVKAQQAKNRDVQAAKARLESDISSLRSQIATLESNFHTLSEDHRQLLTEFTSCSFERDEAQSCLSEARKESSELNEKLAALESAHGTTEGLLRATKEDLEEAQVHHTQVLAEKAMLEDNLATLESANFTIEGELREAQQNLDFARVDQEELQDLLTEKARLGKDVESLKECLHAGGKKFAELQSQKETSKRNIVALETTLNQVESELRETQRVDKQRSQGLMQQVEELESTNMTLAIQRDNVEVARSELASTVESLRDRLSASAVRLEEALDEMKAQQEMSSSLISERKELSMKNTALETELSSLRDHGALLESQIQKLTEDLHRLEADATSKEWESEVEAQNADLVETIRELKEIVDEKTSEVSVLAGECTVSAGEVSALKESIVQLKAVVKSKDSTIQDERESAAKIETELNAELQSVRSQVDELEQKRTVGSCEVTTCEDHGSEPAEIASQVGYSMGAKDEAEISRMAGARLLFNAIERKSRLEKAHAFRKWSCFAGAMKASSAQKEASRALSKELEVTWQKLGMLKSHVKKGKRSRLRSMLLPKREKENAEGGNELLDL